MPTEGHKPITRFEADGRDVTVNLRDRLLSLKIDARADEVSDTIELRLDRRQADGKAIALPKLDMRLAASVGYERGPMQTAEGRVTELESAGPPDTLIVHADGAAFAKSLRSRQSRSWHPGDGPAGYDGTLASMVRVIADTHGLTPKIAPSVADVRVDHYEQTRQSDLEILRTIGDRHDVNIRPVGDKLVAVPQGQPVNAAGVDVPGVTVRPTDTIKYAFTRIARRDPGAAGESETGGVMARWRDYDAGKTKEVTVGDPPYQELKWLYPTREKALAAAQAQYAQQSRERKRLTLTLPGDPRIRPHAPLTLDGFDATFPADWLVSRVTHTVNADGFRSEVEAHLPGG